MNNDNFLIVLFKNKTRKKIINKFKTSKRALNFFNKILSDSDKVIFNREYENGSPCSFEIAIVEKSEKKLFPHFVTDEYGRNVKIELSDDDHDIIKIVKYNVDEQIFDNQINKRIYVNDFIKKYLGSDGLKMISSLNNKIIVQLDSNIYLFSLKTENDSSRFIDQLSSHFVKIKRFDCIFVKDVSTAQRKYLYNLLEEYGFSRKVLYRQSTTFEVKK